MFVLGLMVLGPSQPLSAYTNGFGVVFFSMMGSFAVPVAVGLFFKGAHQRVLLIIAGVALILNGMIRLSVVAVPELVAQVGLATPLVEVVVFTLLGVGALMLARSKSG